MPGTGDPDRVVIAGAGLAGGNVAVTLRGEGFRGRIVMIGSEPDRPFGRPPLSKTYLRGEEDLTHWYVKPAEWYGRNDIELRLETTVTGIDTDTRTVRLQSGETLGYDRLVLCTGGRPRKPGFPGVDLAGVHLLRTVADCEAVKRAARPGARAVVVGMGFIGSEVAASLRQLGLVVTAVFDSASPLERVLGTEVGAVIAGIHRDQGVALIGADRVVRFEGTDVVERVVTERGRQVECDLAVVGAGIDPDVATVEATWIATDNGILVDQGCRTSIADVYAAGDVANHLHPLFGRVRVEHYNSAEKMGRAAARAILGDDEPFGYVHSFWSDQFEHNLEYVGHAKRWDTFVVRGSAAERRFLGFYLEAGVLRAVVGLNRGGDPELEDNSELRACQSLIAARAALSPDILANEQVDLQALATGRRR